MEYDNAYHDNDNLAHVFEGNLIRYNKAPLFRRICYEIGIKYHYV